MKPAFVLLMLAAQAATSIAQTPSRPSEGQVIGVTTTAVEVDVVVRDAKGRPLSELGPEDFEVFEDGVRQQIASFKRVSRGIGFAVLAREGGPDPKFSAPAKVTDPSAGTGTLALVFDRLNPESRILAYKAALGYLESGKLPGDRIGVFAIDLKMRVLQRFTEDIAAVSSALRQAAHQTSPQFESTNAKQNALLGRASSVEAQAQAGLDAIAAGGQANANSAGVAGQSIGGALAEALAIEMETRALASFEALERDQQGYATTNALSAVVSALREVPGRKTIVFFSEGLVLPPAVQHHFRSVISWANRSNVAIYAMDASGLRIESTLEQTRVELNAAARARIQQNLTGRETANGAMMKVLERNEDMLSADPHSGLGMLASDTGGFLIANTNDLKTGFRRIDEDMRFHYLLTYAPTNQEYDGRFREIAVKVKRPGVEVRARKGYFAVPASGAAPVLAFEAPAMALLDSPKLPNAFPMRAAAYAFPERARPGLTPVLVQVGTDALTFREDKDRELYNADFAIVVRLKDRQDEIVRKLSQHYELRGPIAQLEMARRGEVLFYKDPELAPGVYTMEAIVYDLLAGRASARIATVEVPNATAKDLRVSSLMVVRRSEKVPEGERDLTNPLYYGNLLLYPSLGEPLPKNQFPELSFFATIYPGERTEALQASLALVQNGRPLAVTPVELPKPDAAGRVQHVGRLPLEQLPPGSYELRLTVTDGRAKQARTTKFTVTG